METPDRSRLADLRVGMMYSPPTFDTSALGKRILDVGFLFDDNGTLQLTPMAHSHTVPGTILTGDRLLAVEKRARLEFETSTDNESRETTPGTGSSDDTELSDGESIIFLGANHNPESPEVISVSDGDSNLGDHNDINVDLLEADDIDPVPLLPGDLTSADLLLLFIPTPGLFHSETGLVYFSERSIREICFIDFWVTETSLREDLRSTFLVHLIGLKPEPGEHEDEDDSKEIKELYLQYSSLFSPLDAYDEERSPELMVWFSTPPPNLFRFLRSFSDFSQWSFRSLLWDYLSNPVSFLCDFNKYLYAMSAEVLWDFKALLWDYLTDPFYRSGKDVRTVCPYLARKEFPFLRLLDDLVVDFPYLESTSCSPQSPISTVLIPSLRALPAGPSSIYDHNLYLLGQLSWEYRTLHLLNSRAAVAWVHVNPSHDYSNQWWWFDNLTPQMQARLHSLK